MAPDTEEEQMDDDEDEIYLERNFAEEYLRNKISLERETTESRLRWNAERLSFKINFFIIN